MITLTLKQQPVVPLEAESLSPDVMAGLSHDAIRALPESNLVASCSADIASENTPTTWLRCCAPSCSTATAAAS